MPGYKTALRLFVVAFIAAVALVFVLSAGAQSGRRTKKTTPAPIPTAAAEPTPPKVVEKPRLSLIVGMERPDSLGFNVIHPETVLMSVTDRLDDSPAVRVEQVRRDMNRSDAIRRAKSEEAAYVVLLELEAESRTAVSIRVNDLSIQYSVFSPTTAKLKAFGRTYPQAARGRDVILHPGRGNTQDSYQLQQAGRHAAERILKAFDLPLANRGFWARRD